MWNQITTDALGGIQAETILYPGNNSDQIHAYFARPLGDGRYPGIVLIHHMPGWDEFYREMARRLATHGYSVLCPDLYCRFGHGAPDDIAAKVRGEGGVADESVVGDCAAARDWLRALPSSNGKVGITGTCSGGRHAYLTACRAQGFDAVADLWGGRVVMAPQDLTPQLPVAPIDLTKDLSAPLLGLFGEDDQNPSPAQVAQHEEELKKYGKNYEFHSYPGAGHGFFYYDRPAYRQQQAMDGWQKLFAFFNKNLQS